MNRSRGNNAIVFGHADGDGYLASEVSRNNLAADGWSVTETVVEPSFTPNYRFWEKHFQTRNFDSADLVLIVDIAFDFKNPLVSADALFSKATKYPETQFLVIDHHPLNINGSSPPNVTLRPTESVFQCCYGEPNDLMVIASICDKDEEPVQNLITDAHRTLAKGVTRASADKKGVAGRRLMSALGNNEWAWLFTLGSESGDAHKALYGNRTRSSKPSAALQLALDREYPVINVLGTHS